MDRDAQGGNPFATALIHLLSANQMSFARFKEDLVALTRTASHGMQQPEIVGGDDLAGWSLLPRPRGERRTALVVVFTAYSAPIRASLPGARRDYHRVPAALLKAGFEVTSARDPDGPTLARILVDFARRSAAADVALVYTTGHGVEMHGEARVLLPYVRADGGNALLISELARLARARRTNLIFYAACRTPQ